MYKFRYDYAKMKYGDKAKLCFTDTDSLILHVKSDVYEQFARDVEKRFNTSNYEFQRPSIGINKEVNGLIKDELGENIMKSLWLFSLRCTVIS